MYNSGIGGMISFLDDPWHGSLKEIKILGTTSNCLEYITINIVRNLGF